MQQSHGFRRFHFSAAHHEGVQDLPVRQGSLQAPAFGVSPLLMFLYRSGSKDRLLTADPTRRTNSLAFGPSSRTQDCIFCRYEKEVNGSNGVPAYRFTPPKNVFGTPEENPENACYCPHGPPCTPSGFFNVSLCQYGKRASGRVAGFIFWTYIVFALQIPRFCCPSRTSTSPTTATGRRSTVSVLLILRSTRCTWMYSL